ncbi:hypothetical protein BCS42_15870 [Crenothrix sp. D3]|nr:hypothetical protein BCS42_15870 [Crenothrix sp. D3]
MATKEINKTKILVKVHEPLITIMQHKIEAACLKRDAYLDKALRIEAEFLREEMATPNSDKAKKFITEQLSELRLKPLTLVLSTETVNLINEVCKEKNVPRDAFMNRFFLLLIATDTVLTALFNEFLSIADLATMGEFSESHGWDYLEEAGYYYPSSATVELMFRTKVALDSLEEIATKVSPFLNVRLFINFIIYKYGDEYGDERIRSFHKAMYSFPFEENALKMLPDDYDFLRVDNSLGFNTFISDEYIERCESFIELDDLLTKQPEKEKFLSVMKKEKKEKQQAVFESLEKRRAKIEGEAK